MLGGGRLMPPAEPRSDVFEVLDFSLLTYNGQATKLTWPEVNDIKNDQKIIEVFFVELAMAYPTPFTACRYLS